MRGGGVGKAGKFVAFRRCRSPIEENIGENYEITRKDQQKIAKPKVQEQFCRLEPEVAKS